MKTEILDRIKKVTYGSVLTIGSIKTVGFKSEESYYFDKDTYLFGKIIKTKRIWNHSDLKKAKKTRITVTGFGKPDKKA